LKCKHIEWIKNNEIRILKNMEVNNFKEQLNRSRVSNVIKKGNMVPCNERSKKMKNNI
jgi:hypothetical protein